MTAVQIDGPPRVWWDRVVLYGNLVAGALWLVVLVLQMWPLAVPFAVQVAIGAPFLAVAYARGPMPPRQEALVWAVGWLSGVMVWAIVFRLMGGGGLSLAYGLLPGTIFYILWQLTALGMRQLLTWLGKGTTPKR